MKIIEIEIFKFRSISKCVIQMSEINAIVGENNAGKTAILRALNSFFNYEFESKYFEDNTHQFAKRSNTRISILFMDIPDKLLYQGKTSNNTLRVEFQFAYSDNRKTISYIINGQKVTVDDTFIEDLKQDIDYVYIPANRSNKDLSWGENSIFSRLIRKYTSQYTQNRDNISASASKAAEKMRVMVLSKVEKNISQMYLESDSVDFAIEYTHPIDYTVFLNKIGLVVRDCGSAYPINECGSGIKSLTVIALYRALAQINNSSIVLGIEEPETNLHPQAQKRLISSLKNNKEDNEIQTIFATHSTVIIDELEHEDIILVRRISDPSRGFFSKVTQLKKTFWDDNNIEQFRHYQFFKYRNSDFFFAKYVVLTESPIDAQVITRLIKDKVENKIYDVSILSLDGIANIKYPYALIQALELPFSIVVDRDFFVQYRNNNQLDSSRDARTGLPMYSRSLKQDNEIIQAIFKTDQQKRELEERLNGGYRNLFSFLKAKHILTMNYCLEMDLCCSSLAREHYYRLLNVMPAEQTLKSLLTTKFKGIKDAKRILEIVDSLPPSSYPSSFSMIKNELINELNTNIR